MDCERFAAYRLQPDTLPQLGLDRSRTGSFPASSLREEMTNLRFGSFNADWISWRLSATLLDGLQIGVGSGVDGVPVLTNRPGKALEIRLAQLLGFHGGKSIEAALIWTSAVELV